MPLHAETVQGSARSLEGVDDVHRGDGLSSGVLGVRDRVSDDVLEEALEDGSGLVVDAARDALDAASAGETPDGGLGDAGDAVAQDLVVSLRASGLALTTGGQRQALSSLAVSSHLLLL